VGGGGGGGGGGGRVTVTHSTLRDSSSIYHLVSNEGSWNPCYSFHFT